MNRVMWIRMLAVCCAAVLLTFGAHAGELSPPGPPSSSMKRLDQIDPSVCIESLPHTITSPGRYTLCGDLTGASGQPGIIILASDVVLDGNGFVLQGVAGSLDGIFVEGDQRNVQVSRVVVRGWDAHGVHAPSSSVVCSSVVSSENGGSGFKLNAAVLEDCVGNDNGGDGCDINAARPGRGHVTVLKRCEFSGNTGAGLRCADGAGLDCDDLRCDSNGAEGLSIVGGNGHVTVLKRCDSSSNAGSGLHVTGTDRLVCEDSSFRDNDSDGDGVGDGIDIVGKTGHVTLLKRSDSSGNGGNGLHISGFDLLTMEQCTFFSNGQDGLRANGTHFPDAVIVVRCNASRNAGSGLHLTDTSGDCDDSDFVGNGGNGVTAEFGTADVSVFGYTPEEISTSACRVSGNTGHGVHVSSTADDTSFRVALSSSSFGGNGLDACRVDSSSHSSVSSSVLLSACVMDRNVGSGLHVTTGPDNDCDGVVERCDVSSNGSHGVQVDHSASSGKTGWKVEEGTRFHDNAGDGMRVTGGGGAGKVSLQDFHFTSNAGHGLHVVTGGSDGSDGLPASSLDVVAHNGRLLDNDGDGLRMSTGAGGGAGKATFSDLHCVRNGLHGLSVSCPATIEDSTFADNALHGLRSRHVKTGHVTLLKRVVASGNGGSGISGDCDDEDPSSMDLRISDAVCTRNGEHGVTVAGSPLTEEFSLNFEEIKVTYNGQSGLHVAAGSSSVACDVSLSRCDAVSNGAAGVSVVGSTGGGGLPPGAVSVVATGGRCEDNAGDGMLVSRSSGSGGGAGKVSMQDMHFVRNTGSGLSTDCPSSLEACDFSSNSEHGLKLTGRKEFKGHVTLLKRCVASDNGGNGIDVDTDEVDVVMDLHVLDAVCSSNAGNGLHIFADEPTADVSVACSNVSSNNNGAHGMLIVPVAMDKGLRFSADRCSFSRNTSSGISVGDEGLDSCTVRSTEASGNGGGGMVLAGNTVHFLSNTASGNTGNGISISSSLGGVVRDNTCNNNTERGITINTSHVEYATNRCASNGVAGIEVAGGFGNVVRDNYLSGNGSFGIVLGSSENRLYENRTGVQVNPLFESAPGLVNDTAPPAPAAVRGDPNIGF